MVGDCRAGPIAEFFADGEGGPEEYNLPEAVRKVYPALSSAAFAAARVLRDSYPELSLEQEKYMMTGAFILAGALTEYAQRELAETIVGDSSEASD